MESMINEWRAAAKYHTLALAEANAKIQQLSAAALKEHIDVEGAALKLAASDSKPYKTAWRRLIASGMVDNVMNILDECYDPFRDKESCAPYLAARALGPRGSIKWQEFGVRVIHYLKEKGSFGSLEDGFNDFEDTAGGCDEITWDAGCYLLEHPEWQPRAISN